MNKKGQELTIGTLILIVLGIVILVMVILGFAIGWENLFEKVKILPGGTSLGSKVSACKIAISSNVKADYCQFDKLKTDIGTVYANCEYAPVKSGLDATGIACDANVASNYCVNVLGKQANFKSAMVNADVVNCNVVAAAGSTAQTAKFG